MRFILICATGRSGSTTLMRIINTIPNTNICGENNNALFYLLKFYKNLKYTMTMRHIEQVNGKYVHLSYERYIEKDIKPAWYNSYNFNRMKVKIKEMIIDMFKINEKTEIIGFKEIRYCDKLDILNTFIELFPNTQIIIHIKNDIEKQSKSSWWAKNPEESKLKLQKYNKQLIDFYNNNKNICYLSTFENMLNVNEMQKIFKFLNKELDEGKYDKICSHNMR